MTVALVNTAASDDIVSCSTCRNMRHIPRDNGSFARCPDCYDRTIVQREIRVRNYPQLWRTLTPELVMQAFGASSLIPSCMQGLLQGLLLRVHVHGLPNERRHAFVGAMAHGFLQQGRGAQVLDAAELAHKHFAKEAQHWASIERQREPVIYTLGREVETRLGFFYLRQLLDRAVIYQLPFVLVTDYPIETHAPRYPDLMPVIEAARFDRLNLNLAD